MRVLIINNAAIGFQNGELNVFKTTGEFGSELKKIGNIVEFFQIYQKSESSINTFNLLNNGINVTVSKKYNSKFLTYIVAYFKGIVRISHNDFIYIYYPNSFKYLAIFVKLFGKKYGLNVRGEKGVESTISKLLYKYAECVFTVSPKFTQIVNSAGGKAYTQKPSISFTSKDIIKNRVYISKECYSILYLGRIDREKGIFELLDAIKKLKQETTFKFFVNIVGNGADLNSLRTHAQAINISEHVNFLGSINDQEFIKKLYSAADIYILPTYHEGFPRTLYEAMIFGTPIITTFVGGITAIMKDGYNCFQIQPKSIDSIYNKLSEVMTTYPSVTSIAKMGTETVSEIISPARLTHAQHFNKIINGL